VDHVHDHAALEHLGQTGLHTERRLVSHCQSCYPRLGCTICHMATESPDLIGPDDVAFTLDLTPGQLKIVHAAVKAFRADFGHNEPDGNRIANEVLAKLPDESSIRAITL